MKPNMNKKKIQAARRRRYTNRYKSNGSYIETFITQCIVSGIIFCAVLIIRIVDVPTTTAMREHFYQTITATADMAGDARSLGETIRTVIGTDDTDNIIDNYDDISVNISTPNQDFRIDEDILESIRGGDSTER